MKLNIWAPAFEGTSDIDLYAAEQAQGLAAHLTVARVSESEADTPPAADLDLFHMGNSPAHGFIYRAAIARPGVVLLHAWNLHDLVWSETVGHGDTPEYLKEMRHNHGEAGAFIGRQIALGQGGDVWRARHPLNDRILERSLGIVALTPTGASRVAQRVRDLPVLALPRHLTRSEPSPATRADTRAAMTLADDAFVVLAPMLGANPKELGLVMRIVARVRARHPQIRLVVVSPEDFAQRLVIADAVLILGVPGHGDLPSAVVSAMGAGCPVLLYGGTPAAEAFPDGVVVAIDPGWTSASLEAVLSRLVEDVPLRERLGRLARAHVLAHHDLASTARMLADFLRDVSQNRERLVQAVRSRGPAEGTLRGCLLDEARATAHDLGLGHVSLGIESLL